MNWDNTTLFDDEAPEDRAFREEVRRWIGENCPPEVRHQTARITPMRMKEWHRRLYLKGWIAPDWPKEHGGMGATLTQQIILFEEMTRYGAEPPHPHGLSFVGPIIIRAGTEEQKVRFLPPILSGEHTWCQGYSEPGAGSDLASLSTRAELVGDKFIVNGEKVWTTNGSEADWMFALVRTNPKAVPPHAGISMLLIDLRSRGVTIRPIKTLKGDEEFASEVFDNVEVPRENLLGPLHGGWALATALLGAERIVTSSPAPVGRLLNLAYRIAIRAGAEHDPAFRATLTELEVELLAFTAYYRRAARAGSRHGLDIGTASVIKVVGSELWLKAAELAIQIAGAEGPTFTDFNLDDEAVNMLIWLLEARRLTIGGGSLEIQRNVLAKRALGLPGG